jgi:hypothetical protein
VRAPLGPWLALPALVVAGVAVAGCHLDSGSSIVDFLPYGAGPADAVGSVEFTSPLGFDVTLTKVTAHVGAIYLTTAVSGGDSANTSCVEPGLYIGEVPGAGNLDLLNPTPQEFTVTGDGTSGTVTTAEIWLTNGDINATDDTAVITLEGTAEKGNEIYPFSASVSIGSNRLKPVTNPALPGLNPICKRRIITVPTPPFSTENGQDLVMRMDPRGWFNSVDFSQLDPDPTSPGRYVIPDSDSSGTIGEAAGRNLFTGILTGVLPTGASAYSFAFVSSVSSSAP